MEKLTGIIDHFLFKNDSNGYGVFELTTEDDDVICVGTVAGIDQGEMVEVEGEYTIHPTYGPQLKLSSIKVIPPTGIIGIERYLASGAIKGIGPKIAKRITRTFGEDTLRIMQEEPERLTEISGISERIAQQIAEQVITKKEQQDVMVFLAEYGISQNMSLKIYEAFGTYVYTVIKENPYKIIDEVDGVGFKKADDIAKKVGIKVDSEYRIQSGIYYTLSQALGEGHTYLPEEVLLERAASLLNVKQEDVAAQLPNLVIERKLVMKENDGVKAYYTSMLYHQELGVATMLKMLEEFGEAKKRHSYDRVISEIESELGLKLDEKQKQAVIHSMQNNVLIITGGPGTGKTTTINAIIKAIEKEGTEVMLAAPTGRAAKRMTEATGYEAKTIHRMLELNGGLSEEKKGAYFERNADNPLEADVFIVDEMSMVDISLFYSLLKAIPLGARIILVGDVNQLPSVGAGQVLYDLIASERYATVVLEHIFRQGELSDIVSNAHKINRGEEITLDTKSRDFLFLERRDVNQIYEHMRYFIMEKLPSYVNADPLQIQILTPTRIGPLGVEALNRVFQNFFNPPTEDKKEKEYGENVFRVGDKVMQTKNNYELEWEIKGKNGILIDRGVGIFNGDVGTVIDVDKIQGLLCVEFDENRVVKYTYDGLSELELAYAITIHKSQGSEYPAVVMPLLNGPKPLLNRNLLYTGVTRAKKCVMILGSSDTVKQMINNESEKKRYTGLGMRILELKG